MAGAGRQPFEAEHTASPPSPENASAAVIDIRVAEETEHLVVLQVSGELDMLTAPILTEHVQEQLNRDATGAPRTVVFDLTRVSFLGSAGLAVLAQAHTAASNRGDAVQIVATARAVLRPLEVTGLDKVLDVRPHVPAHHDSD